MTETDTRARERFYEGFAADFDRKMNRYDLERRMEIVRRLMNELPRDGQGASSPLVLDGGSGTGWFSRQAKEDGFRVIALDLGPNLLTEVRRKCDVPCVAGSALDLPFPDGTFDMVMSNEVIEHTPDPAAAVRDYARVLRPGGHLVLTCPNRAWHWSLAVAKLLNLRPYQGLENWPRYDQLRQFVEASGLEVVRQFGFNLFPFQLPGAPRVLRACDRWFSWAGQWMINQGIVARRVAREQRTRR